MAGDILEEWDDAFLEQLIEVEEIALTSTNPTQTHPPLPQPHPKPSHYPLKKSYPAPIYGGDSYSPPRELSQRVPDGNKKGDFDAGFSSIGHTVLAPVLPRVNDVKKDSNLGFVTSHPGSRNPQDDEIDRLKRELSRVSKELTSMEQDCILLRKERDKKEEQLKFVFSSSEAKVAVIHDTESKNSEYGVHTHGDPGISANVQNGISSIQVGSRVDTGTPSRKEVGIQTDQCGEYPKQFIRDDLSTPQRCRNKLLAIWNSPSDRGSFSNLVSTLLVVCEADFHVLFGWLSISTKRKMSSASDERSFNMGLHCDKVAPQSAEATKVSRLYSMLTQIGTGMVKLESFFEALVDLCSLENEVIVYRSLRVLHRALNHVYTPETNVRDNVIVEETPPHIETEDACSSKFPAREHRFPTDGDEMDITCLNTCETRLSDGERLCKQKQRNHGPALSTTHLDWVSMFKLMHQIAMRKTDECLRLEAVSVMNVILRRSNAYSEREQFANLLGFQSVSHLLRKESGVRVQKEAVHLLYLILNCPKLFDNFCLGCKEEVKGAEVGTSDVRAASTVQGFSSILDGLADCLACDGNGTQELKLRKISVTVLSFLSSSSHLGFEIMLNHSLQERNNFLALILHMLISEMDAEAVNSSHPSETFKERTLLIREALILLNRLVSNPPYATPVLQVLTNSRVVACLTVDVANRLSCKVKWVWQNDGITRQIRESEIVNLARGFKNRIFTFLGDRDSEHS